MNLSFHSQSTEIDFAQASSLIELTETNLSILVLDQNNCFSALVVYNFDASKNILAEIKEIFFYSELLKNKFKKLTILWSLPHAILVPSEWMHVDFKKEMLQLVYGDCNEEIVKSDFLIQQNAYNIYSVDKNIHDEFMHQFAMHIQIHIYSLLPNLWPIFNENTLTIIFYQHHFVVMLYKNNELQIIQQYTYTDEEIVAYYLLNICKQYAVDPINITLQLCGTITKDSKLYNELYKYFLQIHFISLPNGATYSEEIMEQPHHFFTHLIACALCV